MRKHSLMNVVLASSLAFSLAGTPALVYAVENQPFFEYTAGQTYAEGVVDIDTAASFYTQADAQHLRELAQLSMQYKKIYDAYEATLPSYESFIQWMSSMLKPDAHNDTLTNAYIERVVGMKKAEASGKLKTQFNDIKAELNNKINEAPADNRPRVQATIDKLEALATGADIDPANPEVAGTLEAAKQLIANPAAKPPVPGYTEAPQTSEADVFRSTYRDLLAKTPETVVESDEDRINDALVTLGTLAPDQQAQLTAEKTLLEDMLMAVQERQLTESQVNEFRATYADVLAKTPETVALTDTGDVRRGLQAYASYTAAAQTELAPEKQTLDTLKAVLDAKGEAELFKTKYADLLSMHNNDVNFEHEDLLKQALAENRALAPEVQRWLQPETELLNRMEARMRERHEARAQADAFKEKYSSVLGQKSDEAAGIDDLDVINAALAEWETLDWLAQQDLLAEKDELEARKALAEANKAKVEAYLANHEALLSKGKLTTADLDALNAALADYEQLDVATQQALRGVYEELLAKKAELTGTTKPAQTTKKKLPKTGEAVVAGMTALGGLLSVLAARAIKRSED